MGRRGVAKGVVKVERDLQIGVATERAWQSVRKVRKRAWEAGREGSGRDITSWEVNEAWQGAWHGGREGGRVMLKAVVYGQGET